MGQDASTSDAEAFAWFFTAEYGQVVRVLTVVLHERPAAEDLAQEAFVRLHLHWAKVSRYDRPEVWVRRVALNLAFSYRRREYRRRTLEAVATWPEVEPEWNPRVDHDDVIAAIRTLKPRERALIALFHMEDRPLDEVSDVLGMTPGAAKVALHRARRRLARRLTDTEVTP